MKSRVFLFAAAVLLGFFFPVAEAQTFTTLHNFTALVYDADHGIYTNVDGATPIGSLILSGTILYGSAFSGGRGGSGTLFAVNVDGGGFTNLYTFSAIIDTNRYNADGSAPVDGLLLSGNTLYGTASGGGSSGYGTVFSVNTDGSDFSTLYNFNLLDGDLPNGGLVLSGNTLYGSTQGGGISDVPVVWGTVFAATTNGTGITTLHNFASPMGYNYTNNDGEYPNGGLILSGGILYGTAIDGGSASDGTVFAVNTNGTGFSTLHVFHGSDGSSPSAGLILSGNTLYGTTELGGSSGSGTVFSVKTDGSGYANLYSFSRAINSNNIYINIDGVGPSSSLVLSGNTLYGTSLFGGSSGDGTVFALNTDGTGFTTLHSFTGGSDGAQPYEGLILSGNTLYGAAYGGGTSGYGTVFSLTLGPITTLPATSVGNLSATLNGSVSPNGMAATTYFQYDTDTTYGMTTPTYVVGSGANSEVPLSANISGLAANTIYHYQAVAVVGGVSYFGADQTVTTEPSLLALASLSGDAYSSSPMGYSTPPKYIYLGGYSNFVESAAPDGFAVSAYTNADNSQIVIAFRGTVPPFPLPTYTTIINVMADYGFRGANPSITLQDYASAAAYFVSNVQRQYPNANITLTGHSLGGALAQLVGQASGLTAAGFNAPGSASVYTALKTYLSSGAWPPLSVTDPNTNYRIDGDVVSLCGTPFPSTVSLSSPISLPLILPDPTLTVLRSLYFFLEVHNITTVISQIAANAPQTLGVAGPNEAEVFENAIELVSTASPGLGQSSYNFDFQVNDITGTLLNPEQTGGADFVYSEDTGSPNISSIALPVLSGVSSYAIRSETGSTWSSFQSIQPGSQFVFDPVNGVEFVALDQNGNPVAETNLVFALYFASTGTVSGALIQSTTSPPLPPVLQVAVVGNQLNLAWNTNVVPGLELVSTTNLVAPINWSLVTNAIVVVSNQFAVTIPIVNQMQFFRFQQ